MQFKFTVIATLAWIGSLIALSKSDHDPLANLAIFLVCIGYLALLIGQRSQAKKLAQLIDEFADHRNAA